MSARPIGELFAPIVGRCERLMWLHRLLDRVPCASAKKNLIMTAFRIGRIDGSEAQLLVQVYQLETA